MKSIFEYLISKENKDRVKLPITNGDIILYSDRNYYIYLDYNTFDDFVKTKVSIKSWWDLWKDYFLAGLFISTKKCVSLAMLDSKMMNMEHHGEMVLNLYRGDLPRDFFKKYEEYISQESLEKLTEGRKKKKIN